MKKNTLYLFILLLITGLNTSCNYLDIVPERNSHGKGCLCQSPCCTADIYIPATVSASVKHGSVMYGLYR